MCGQGGGGTDTNSHNMWLAARVLGAVLRWVVVNICRKHPSNPYYLTVPVRPFRIANMLQSILCVKDVNILRTAAAPSSHMSLHCPTSAHTGLRPFGASAVSHAHVICPAFHRGTMGRLHPASQTATRRLSCCSMRCTSHVHRVHQHLIQVGTLDLVLQLRGAGGGGTPRSPSWAHWI
mgnify:CR=1 FL=1